MPRTRRPSGVSADTSTAAPATSALAPSTPGSATPLQEYRRKRDPLATNEPFGAERKASALETRSGRFVVHLHSARQRHYDLRLQIGRSLASFAVPRGPSLDPAQRRLAVLTEDHPLEYVDFEAVIPAGNYGAGPMICWDVGRVSYLEAAAETGVQNGKLDFWLQGFKLRGRFALVRTKRGEGNEWLLIKKQDAHSRETGDILEEQPESVLSGLTVDQLEQRRAIASEIERQAVAYGAKRADIDAAHLQPMLCRDSEASHAEGDAATELAHPALIDAERVFELKVDGVRIVATLADGEVSLRYRNGRIATSSYPEIVRAVQTLPVDRAVLDGEIVTFDERGRPSFQRLGPRIHAQRPEDVSRVAAEIPVVYWVFDLISVNGLDLRPLALRERKTLLTALVRGRGLVRRLDHLEGQGAHLFRFCSEQGLEGVVAKRRDSRYRPGPIRSDDWLKIKCLIEDDFVVIGLVRGKGAREQLGALALGSYVDGKLIYRGRVGSGFDDRSVKEMLALLTPLLGAPCLLEPPLPVETKPVLWVEPRCVVRVRFSGFSEDGVLRHSVYVGLRPDVSPEDCHAAPAAHEEDDPTGAVGVSAVGVSGATAPGTSTLSANAPANSRSAATKVQLTNLEKVYFPEQGYKKGDLIDYYAAVAPVMLPFLKDRPVMLVRYPDGIHGKNFFQWHVPRGTPSWIRTLTIRDDEDASREKTVFLLDDLDALLHVANLGCIPLHVLACRAGSLEFADYLTFDFDLGEQPFLRAVELSLALGELLEEIGLRGF
ncbi:MAG TPA: non-homologous end-joining DNA ligase, partial [Polyangiaceae bacterium]|nr:non-homologous end-joining DNA ligase [Polyangiaceae bacterium]